MVRTGLLWAGALVLAAGAWTPAAAQSADDQWHMAVSPYFMGASMNGTTTVRGFDVDTNLSASDIFSNLQFGAMGIIAARKGDWGVGSDLIWMALGTQVADRNLNVDFNQGAFAFYGLRRLGPNAEATFGMRVNTLQGKLTFTGPDAAREQNKTWVDPIVGLMLRSSEANRLLVRLYTEIGGFGAGSTFTWQAFPSVGIKLGEKASLDFGYRWLDIDYSTGDGNDKFAYNVLTQGPVAGFTFKF